MKKVKLSKVNRVRSFEQAVDQIRSLIENGDLSTNDRLPTEVELSEQLNIGRSSIREALRVLETEGMIDVRQGAGTFVTPRSEWVSSRSEAVSWLKQRGESLIQLLQVREWLEGLCVELVAASPSPEVIEKLTQILNEMSEFIGEAGDDYSKLDLGKVADLNTRFHLTISYHSGNMIAHEILSHILPAFSESNKVVLYTNTRLELQASEHHEILQAIIDADKAKAVKCLRAHISRVSHEIQDIQVSE